jgi:tetratricopeptide (TPR) repeat protein
MKKRIYFFLVILLLAANVIRAQNQGGVRAQIDQERAQLRLSYTDPKIYETARNFIRRDSTYYMGYMFEGAYLFFRANDELGFTLAIPSLKKALDKIEHDFDPLLKLRTNNYNDYAANYRYHLDYGLIAYFLNRCYQNIEDQDKAMDVLRHMRVRDFQLEFNLDSYNTMAWLYHRNRMFTSKRFKFLKNSVKENVEAANRCLDSAIRKIRNDMPYNNGLYDPNMLNRQYLSTYHYKAMIHDYLLDIDSANYYYDVLIQNGAYSSNNYAEFKLAMGEFDEAELYFEEAADRESNVEKTTKEYYYMRGTLAIYRGHPERADSLLNDILQKQGSTPGYGWHCIGLARAQHYEGLTAESMERINKAARFQELHIGTTWGQEQYNLAVASLHYLNQLNFKKEYLFEHNEWYFWLNPVNWYRWVKYTLEIRHHKMVLASLVAENPEREQVIYSLFSPENLVTFDEVWSVMEGFGNEYFIKIYKNKLATDKRPRLKKYFKYVLGKLYLAEGKESEAINYFNQVLQETDGNDPYQTLLVARTYEGLANATSGSEREKYTRQLYQLYPQLVPFTDLTMSFRLNGQAKNDAEEKILDDLKNTRIDFTDDGNVPQVSLQFSPRGQSLDINYSVQWQGKVTQQGTLQLDETEKADAGKLIAYRIFGVHKSKIGEQPKATPQAKPEKKEEKKAESADKAV